MPTTAENREARDKLAFDALYYAQGKALDAVEGMEPGVERILAFSHAWKEAILEYLEEHK